MSALQRIVACTIAGILWLGAIIAKHFWPDVDIGAFTVACATIIAALGVHGATVSGPGDMPAVPPAQGGFAFVSLLILIAGIAGVLGLAGCASLTDAGHAGYNLTPVAGGCSFSATDGKEYSSRKITATSGPAGCSMTVDEGASSAFQGEAIAGKALSILPSFAAPILAPGPATLLPQLAVPVKP